MRTRRLDFRQKVGPTNASDLPLGYCTCTHIALLYQQAITGLNYAQNVCTYTESCAYMYGGHYFMVRFLEEPSHDAESK